MWVAYFDERTTSGVVEGINNKLKLIKRRAYGMRNFTNFKLRSFLTWHFTIWFYILSSVEPGKVTGISFIDSTRLPICSNFRATRNKVFEGLANWGKSSIG